MRKWIVMTSSARMPNSCWGRYGNVAVVEIEPDFEGTPKMISTHARGVIEITQYWGGLHSGSNGGNTAFDRALREANELCSDLNKVGEYL